MARLDSYHYPWPWRDAREARSEALRKGQLFPQVDYATEMREEFEALDALIAKSQAVPLDHVVGVVLTWPRGDGRAYYLVTKERPLTLQWIPYGDAWVIEPALVRGLTKDDVFRMRERDRAIARLFSGDHVEDEGPFTARSVLSLPTRPKGKR